MTANVLLNSHDADKKIIDAVKTELDGHRKIFESGEAAFNSLAKIGELVAGAIPMLVAGHGDATTLDALPDWATGRVGISLLGVKREKTTGARAVVVFPVPNVSDYDADPSGHDWLDKIAVKETSHVAFRALRMVPDDVEDPAQLIQASLRMPVTVSEYAEVHRVSGGIDLSAFNEVWGVCRALLIKEYPALKAALPAKGEVVNAIRSASYAASEYQDLESQGLFAFIGTTLVDLCGGLKDEKTGEPRDVDASEIEDWLANRDKLVIQPKERTALTTTLDLTQFKLPGA